MNERGRVRPMQVEDIPQVGRLFFKVFRGKAIESPEDFNIYFKELFFHSPSYDPRYGSYVHEMADGRIDSAMSAIPMQYRATDRLVTARILCTFMTDPAFSAQGAAELTLKLRPRYQELSFSDTAAPVTADHIKAIGGVSIPISGLEWCRVFRISGFLAQFAGEKFPRFTHSLGLPLAHPLDKLLRRTRYSLSVSPSEGMYDEAMSQQAFVAYAPDLLRKYSVRPVWSKPELDWLLNVAGQNRSLGPLHIRSVLDRKRQICGCFVYLGKPGSVAQVLNVLCATGMERHVVHQMLHHLDTAGYVAAKGQVLLDQMDALSRHQAMFYRHKAHVCLTTRHSDIVEAIHHNDIYIGGLAGESWSRLVSDFN